MDLIKNQANKLLQSADNSSNGYSARKLSAFYSIVIAATFLSYKFGDVNNAVKLVDSWLIFAAVCLGLVTAPQIIELINKKSDTTPSQINIDNPDK